MSHAAASTSILPLRRRPRLSRALIALAVIVLVLLIVRVMLPGIARRAITSRLERIPDYTGWVDDVDLALWRGAYTLHGLVVLKRDGAQSDPYFRADRIDFSLAWRELFHRRLVGDVALERPMLTLIKSATPGRTQVTADRRWTEAIADIFPIDITLLKITDGQVRYINDALTPKVDVRIAHVRALATGLRNRPDADAGEFPARLTLEGETIGGGVLKVAAQAEPLATTPHLLLKAEVERVSLPAMNEFLRAYAGVDVSSGTFNGYLEIAARDGHYKGYFKPFFDQVDFAEQAGETTPVGQQIREFFVRAFTWVFKNHPRDEVATRIPFEGETKDLNYSTWTTFVNLLRHAFISPLQKKLDSQAPGGEGAKGEHEKLPEPKKS